VPLLALPAACGGGSTADAETTAKVLKSCAVDGLMPYSSSADSSKPGLEIEMANELADRMGMKNKTVWVGSWDGLIPSLNSKKCDAIIDGLFITDDRKKVVDFTDPTWGSGQVILTRRDDNSVTDLDSLKSKKVGVLQGSTTVPNLKAAGVTHLKMYPSQNEVIIDLANGGVDAAYLESPSAGWALAQDASINVKVVDTYKSSDIFFEGIAVRKGDDALRNKLNTAIKKIQDDGTLAKILKTYGVPVYLPGDEQ
jgi:polar amino acid transport system substrate-binding protein